MGAEILPITATHAVKTWNLREWVNKDLFDRMLATQAIFERATIVAADAALQNCPGLEWFWNTPSAP
jgi:PIN domain nuclease of toxin-antitoxin system